MPRQLKYNVGRQVVNIIDLLDCMNHDTWFYIGNIGHTGRPKHPQIINNMSLHTIRGFLRRGSLHVADLNPDWVKANEVPF